MNLLPFEVGVTQVPHVFIDGTIFFSEEYKCSSFCSVSNSAALLFEPVLLSYNNLLAVSSLLVIDSSTLLDAIEEDFHPRIS
jgi:hypothetical protein